MLGPIGTCSGYPPLLECLAAALRSAAGKNGPDQRRAVAALMPGHCTCPMCAVHEQAEARAIADVVERLDTGTNGTERLSSLCLPHLTVVTDRLGSPDALRDLLNQQALAMERTAEDMRRFTLKQSAARRQLQSKEEQTACQRGLGLAGRRNVTFAVGQAAEPFSASSGGSQNMEDRGRG